MLRKSICGLAVGALMVFMGQATAADYVIDKEGQHAFIDFKVSHLGYSFITGTFRDLDGTFSFDAQNIEDSKLEVNVRTASLFSNHAERDKHLLDKEYLNARQYPVAKFVSTAIKATGKNAEGKTTADVTGDLTLSGVTRPVVVKGVFLGEGADPWGGYRAGFEGRMSIKREDFGQTGKLAPGSSLVDLYITFEGVRKKS
jgi:polyisoprenoid-binding protein YceI